jgi:hypothetical protein
MPALLVVLAGWLPFSCATRDSGYRISEETIAFIQPGVTTRSEVVENLGTPLLELKQPHVVAYSWGKVHVTGGKPAVQAPSMGAGEMNYAAGPPPSEEGNLVEVKRWVCCIALDDKNRVVRVEKIKLEGAPSLEQAVRQWATTPSQR